MSEGFEDEDWSCLVFVMSAFADSSSSPNHGGIGMQQLTSAICDHTDGVSLMLDHRSENAALKPYGLMKQRHELFLKQCVEFGYDKKKPLDIAADTKGWTRPYEPFFASTAMKSAGKFQSAFNLCSLASLGKDDGMVPMWCWRAWFAATFLSKTCGYSNGNSLL